MSAASSATEGNGPRMIPIDQLNIQDLSNLQQQCDKELGFFGDSLQELRNVYAKFRETGESVSQLKPENNGQEIMVPLTNSMYVRGSLDDVRHVLVDIGTGYYAEMSLEKARDYFQRKQDYLAKQIEQVQTVVSEKQRAKGLIMSALETKVQASLAAQQK